MLLVLLKMQGNDSPHIPHGPRFGEQVIVSVGAAYSGLDNVVVSVDVRYFDYENTDGFGTFGPRRVIHWILNDGNE